MLKHVGVSSVYSDKSGRFPLLLWLETEEQAQETPWRSEMKVGNQSENGGKHYGDEKTRVELGDQNKDMGPGWGWRPKVQLEG